MQGNIIDCPSLVPPALEISEVLEGFIVSGNSSSALTTCKWILRWNKLLFPIWNLTCKSSLWRRPSNVWLPSVPAKQNIVSVAVCIQRETESLPGASRACRIHCVFFRQRRVTTVKLSISTKRIPFSIAFSIPYPTFSDFCLHPSRLCGHRLLLAFEHPPSTQQ